MSAWLDPLIDPHELAVAARRGDRQPRAALALLLGGELLQYERFALESEWPRLGTEPRRGASHDELLLAAVGLHLSGSEHAAKAYRRLMRTRVRDDGLATLVGVLAAMECAARRKQDQALNLLRQALAQTSEPLHVMLLALHIGLREAERGNTHAGIDMTVRARDTRKARPPKHARALKVIAEHNAFSYGRLIGQMGDLARLPVRASHLPLIRSAVDMSDGLTKQLEHQFAISTRDPYTRSITWRAEDPVEVPLRSALLRAECLADWAGRDHARRLLGRYLAVSKLGTAEGVSPEAFELLRLAGDHKAMAELTRSVAAIGPLGALRTETQAAVRLPWMDTQRGAVLALLAGGGDLLSASDADEALGRLRTTADVTAMGFVESLRSMSRLLPLASDRSQTTTSRFLRGLAIEWPEPILLQEMGRPIRALRWEAVASREREAWIRYVESHLLDEGDARFLAEAMAAALAATDRGAVAEALLSSYERSPNLSRLALMVDAGITLPPKLRVTAIDDACRALERVRDDAHRGRFGIGGLDNARLVLYLLSGRHDHGGWDLLTDFLLDGRVSVGAKTGAIDELGSQGTSIPRRVRNRLRDGVSAIGGFPGDLEGSPLELQGAALRLWLKLGGLTRDELLSRLLELAGTLDPEGRREAASTLPAAQIKLGDDPTFTLALSLTRDRDVSVRAPAGRSLGRLRRKGPRELAKVVAGRLEALLEEPGTDVPYWTLVGLVEAKRDRQLPPKAVSAAVARVRRTHPSGRVRRLAERL